MADSEVPHRLVKTTSDPDNPNANIYACKCGLTFGTLKEISKHREKGNIVPAPPSKETQ